MGVGRIPESSCVRGVAGVDGQVEVITGGVDQRDSALGERKRVVVDFDVL